MSRDVRNGLGSRRLSRRALLGTAATGLLVAACSSAAPAAPGPGGAAAPAATGAAATNGATAATAPPAAPAAAAPGGQLTLALDSEFPATLDATKSAYQLVRAGMLETLTRLSPKNQIEPWLAKDVKAVDPKTWRVTLRDNAKFWDGSPVDADAVLASLQTSWKVYPVAAGLLSKDTQLKAVDAHTLELTTSDPVPSLPNALSAQFFGIHKNGTVMTGPYKAGTLLAQQQLTLEGFTDHWNGKPPLSKLTIRFVTDPNTKTLALKSGDVDMVYSVSPQQANDLASDFNVVKTMSDREDYLVVNFRQPPFNDLAVRQAISFGVDRQALLTVGLDGQGAVATGMFPDGVGVSTVAIQSSDPAKASKVLDDAGWTMGSDGIRAKGGNRLSFKLLTATVRPEWTPMAVAIQSQLKPLGFDVQLQQVKNIGDELTQHHDFAAAMYSANLLVTGDPLYNFNQTLAKSGPANYGAYENADLEKVLGQMRTESDPSKRSDLVTQAQKIIGTDFPDVYLVVIPFIVATSKKVTGYTLHPNDLYIIDDKIAVTGG